MHLVMEISIRGPYEKKATKTLLKLRYKRNLKDERYRNPTRCLKRNECRKRYEWIKQDGIKENGKKKQIIIYIGPLSIPHENAKQAAIHLNEYWDDGGRDRSVMNEIANKYGRAGEKLSIYFAESIGDSGGSVYKVGITQKSTDERLSRLFSNYVVLLEVELDYWLAKKIEKDVLRVFSKFRCEDSFKLRGYIKQYCAGGTSEIFLLSHPSQSLIIKNYILSQIAQHESQNEFQLAA